jgi:hypothetical protein
MFLRRLFVALEGRLRFRKPLTQNYYFVDLLSRGHRLSTFPPIMVLTATAV